MRRCPEKLLAAEEKVLRFQVENAIERSKTRGVTMVSIPLHRGSDGFISLAAFEKFYWPQFKKMVFDLTDAGLTTVIFWEGCWNQRLHHLAELPKGKTIGWFQSSDIFKVKVVLGDTMCIMGGMPVGLLAGGTPDEIRERTKRVCEVAGKGGGFIMSSEIAELEGCNPDLIKIWIDATKEYGQY
jgi:uroporphyrinogen-III decarboxylase